MYLETTALKKLLKLKKRIRAACGGTSASKTISILLILIDYAQASNGKLVSVVSETFPHLKRGAMRDFLSIMKGHGYFNPNAWNKTDYIYTFPGGSQIEFFSADQPSKVHGPRRNVLFINEANSIPHEIYDQLEVRTDETIWLDWNPVSEFWFYTDVLPHVDCDFITLTYKDNEGLAQSIKESIENRKHNARWWQVYGLGQLGEVEGRIYTGWELIDSVPQLARLERYGLDFGYTNHPSALVAIYYYNGAYILDEVAYQRGLKNNDIAAIIKNQDQGALVVADSAEPKSIDEIKEHGVSIVGAKKGKDSVRQGIQYVQQQKIATTKRSTNLIKEYRNYLWASDKDGKLTQSPNEFQDHAMDAIRYGFDSLRVVTDLVDPNQIHDPALDFRGLW